MRPLTQRQKKVLAFVEEHSHRHGFPPTLREIGSGIGLANVNAVRGHLDALQKKGYIDRSPDKARSIRVVRPQGVSRLSRVKRALHRVARTNEGVLHRIVYGVVLATRKGRPHFAGAARRRIADAIERECVEHGWRLAETRIEPDHLVLVLEVWPNHSPQLTVRRIRAAGEALRRYDGKGFPGRRMWAAGYAVTTDLAQLDAVAEEFLRSRPPEPED